MYICCVCTYSLCFSAPPFIPECFGDLNDEKTFFTVFCNTSSDSQSIVGATYSINGIDSGDGMCVCVCVCVCVHSVGAISHSYLPTCHWSGTPE